MRALATAQQFVASDAYRALADVGIEFIDGYHSEEQARFDYEAFAPLLAADGIVLFHDSVRMATVNIYGAERACERRVKAFLDALKRDAALQVLDLPFANGLTLVRRA